MGLWGSLVAYEVWDFMTQVQILVAPFHNKMKIKDNSETETGLYGKWTERDINEYLKLREDKLTSFYVSKNIPLSNMIGRVNALVELLRPYGFRIESDSINAQAEREGKAKAFVELEKIVLSKY